MCGGGGGGRRKKAPFAAPTNVHVIIFRTVFWAGSCSGHSKVMVKMGIVSRVRYTQISNVSGVYLIHIS